MTTRRAVPQATQPPPATSARKGRAPRSPAAVDPAAPAPETALERLLRYRFHQPALLELALTHRSFAYEARGSAPEARGHQESGGSDKVPCGDEKELRARDQKNDPGTDNEQLEFVGDAVLGLAVTEALFHHFPHCSEGELTRLRSSLVSRQRMAQMGAALDLDQHLRLGRSAEINGGRRKPALLANAAEALLAAVYLDAAAHTGEGLSAVRCILQQHLLDPDLPSMRAALAQTAGRGALRDSKTLLQERVQADGLGRIRYVDVSESGLPHQRRFGVEVHLENEQGTRSLAAAEGSSKKEAQQRAAAAALATWTQIEAQNIAQAEPNSTREGAA